MAEKIYDLSDIDVREVSLVGSPANKRKYLLLKSNGGNDVSDLEKALPEVEQGEIKGILKFLYKLLSKKMPEDEMPEDNKEEPMAEAKKEETKKSETDVKLEAIQKERDDLKAKIEKAEGEKSELVKRVTDLEKADKKRQLTEIAKSIDGPHEDNLKYLGMLSESLPPDKFDIVVKREKAMAEKIKNSGLFGEVGSSRPVPTGALAKLDALAKEKISKSDKKIPYPEALSEAIKEKPDL